MHGAKIGNRQRVLDNSQYGRATINGNLNSNHILINSVHRWDCCIHTGVSFPYIVFIYVTRKYKAMVGLI